MANWKKVLVSGSSIEIASITSSATPTVGTIGSNYVTMIDPTTGYISKITSGNFQASLGAYAYTASAVSGTPIVIGSADVLNISGSGGLTTTISTISGGARINVSANTGNGLSVSSNTIFLDTASSHFSNGVKSAVFQAGNFVDSSEIDFTVTAGASTTAALIAGSIANSKLTNSSIYVTAGNGLTGDGNVSLGGTASLAVGAGTGITVNANDVALKNAGSLTNNFLTKWDSGNGQLTNSALSENGTVVSSTLPLSIGGYITATGALTGSAVSASGAISGLTLSTNQGITAGSFIQAGTNITAPSGYITAGSPAGSPNSVGAVQGQVGFFNTLTTTGNSSVGGNLSVTGDLLVAGTASFTNSTSLLIADKFALLASGSTSLTDGGIIIQNAAGGIGTAFYLEAGTAGSTGTYGRFAVTSSLAANASSANIDEFIVTAKSSTGAPAADPTYGGSTSGYGNIYVNSSNGDIFIYS
jgi:hypothetical protein